MHYLITTPIKKFKADTARGLLEKQINSIKKTGENQDTIVISAERLSGHPYSGGHDRYEIMDRIHQVSPDAKILIFYRDQISMLKSLYKQMVWQGYTGTVQDIIYRETWTGKGFDLSYLEYNLIASSYFQKFGRKNVLLCKFEDFLADKNSVLGKICDFLGVRQYIEEEFLQIKLAQRTEDKTIPARRLLNKFRKTEYVDSPVFVLPTKLSNLICRFFMLFIMDIEINEIDRKYLENYFLEPNKQLSQLLIE